MMQTSNDTSEFDEFLREVLRQAVDRFPMNGLVLVGIDGSDDASPTCDLTVFTNMPDDEVAAVLDAVPTMALENDGELAATCGGRLN